MNSSVTAAAALAELDELVVVVGDLRKYNYVTVASLTALLWDIFLTMPEEVEFVWKARWSSGKLLYIVNRYFTLVTQVAAFPYNFMINPPLQFCNIYFHLDIWLGFLSLVPLQIVIGARTYALFSGSKTFKWIIITVLSLSYVTTIGAFVWYMVSGRVSAPPLRGLTCLLTTSVPRRPGEIAFIGGASYEVILFCLSLYRCYHLVRSGKSNLIMLVVRDCLAYICLVTSAGVTTVFMYNLIPAKHAALQDVLANYAQMMASVATSHILLHLRAYMADGDGGKDGNHRTLSDFSITTIAFREDDEDATAVEMPRRKFLSAGAASWL